uniref:Protein inscuteable n=1 Tax=Ceratitis capitata TaxID=7213 RepID=W8BHQ8_CERCA
MAFQRSYSKVWWGSDNQQLSSALALSAAAGGATANNDGTSFTSGGFYYGSYFAQKTQQQLNAQRLQCNNHGSGGYHSLDSGSFRSYVGNLSRIQEVDDEQNNSKLSWGKRDSPGSLRSQDSGFSDNDESHSGRSLGGRSLKPSSPSAQNAASSPSSVHSAAVATPPTVIRRVGKSEFYSPLVNVSRRISFSGSPATATTLDAAIAATQGETTQLQQRLTADELLVSEAVSAAKKLNFDDANACGGLAVAAPQQAPQQAQQQQQPKRRRRIIRQATKPLSPTKRRTLLEDTDPDSEGERNEGTNLSTSSPFDELDRSAEHNRSRTRLHIAPEYNNETVYLGVTTATPPTAVPYNNETMVLGAGGVITCATQEDTNNNTMKMNEMDMDNSMTPLKNSYLPSTSTPKATVQASVQPWLQMSFRHVTYEYDNPLLNGHASDLQHWLHDLRASYEHEVMSTLQTKSIAQEAFKNLTITTNTVAKLIRQLQQRALNMQTDFERVERILSGTQEATLHEALASAEQLVANVADFTQVLERRAVFFNDSRLDRKRFEENMAQIRIITKDTRYSLERQHYINLESLLDDVQVLKRNLLICVRQLFEKMVRIIVQSVEQGQCDLMLRANINMIATLMNIDYEGFASLTDAFVQNEAVRALLIVCLENKLSSVRALALRALATVCCTPAAIAQLGACGGIEIVRDIIQVPGKERAGEFKRGDIERREAVSLLTQITAAWHGAEHRVDGLKACAELIVEGLTQLITNTACPQTLLLCAAALNNLSRIEVTSHYSIMSNEAIFKLIEVVQVRGEETSIFLYEQIVAMLHNMSVNKKCHSHLANGNIINFITSAYQTEFYKNYKSRAESDAQRRTIKAILHTLTHLVHESTLGIELLEQHRVPAFFRQAMFIGGTGAGSGGEQWYLDGSHGREISSMLAGQLLQAQKQEPVAAVDESKRQQVFRAAVGEIENAAVQQVTANGRGSSRANNNANVSVKGNFKFNLTRQESFV